MDVTKALYLEIFDTLVFICIIFLLYILYEFTVVVEDWWSLLYSISES